MWECGWNSTMLPQFEWWLQAHYKSPNEQGYYISNSLSDLCSCLTSMPCINYKSFIPNTCHYLFHLILHSLNFHGLQYQCCHLMYSLLDILWLPSEETYHVTTTIKYKVYPAQPFADLKLSIWNFSLINIYLQTVKLGCNVLANRDTL